MMNFKSFVYIFILIVVLSSADGSKKSTEHPNPCENNNNSTNKPINDIDILVLSQKWSPTICYQLQKRYKNYTSNLCNEKKWLISGLKPSLQHYPGPAFCNCSMEFDLLKLSPIMKDLETKWIDSLVNSHRNHSYLSHQWTKYGTCGTAINEINNQFNYFNKSLELFDKFNIERILSNNTINPGHSYRKKSFGAAFFKNFNNKVQLTCIVNHDTEEFYLSGIELCFDKQFNLVHCVGSGINRQTDKCPSKKRPIVYLDSILKQAN
ncbi:ribonuclease Oy-like [Microplitis mediator]|uniref:ribonuclease Oy-like n=1 Tax=Microplitis mediator TaxID=375433 RepID=UPI00255384D9|nr:ribonuclease Oy-like [Microplitis mediator]